MTYMDLISETKRNRGTMSIINLAQIEEDILDITEDQSGGFCWLNLSKYIAARCLEHRIDQEINMVPISVMELELAGLERA